MNWQERKAEDGDTSARTPEPDPIRNDGESVHDMVARDIEQRKAFGLEKYGTILQAGNGRDALMDAYQEALDLCCYLRQRIEEDRARLANRVTEPRVELPVSAAEFVAGMDALGAAMEKTYAQRRCNRHADCDAAEAKIGARIVHCHTEDCEDCFGC